MPSAIGVMPPMVARVVIRIGPQAHRGGVQHRIARVHAALAQLIAELYDEDRIFNDDADEHQYADKGRKTERHGRERLA